MKRRKIKVIELFAGVGGFRLGLEGWKGKSASSGYIKNIAPLYEVIWSNQWEPSTKRQHANEVYENRWPHAVHSGSDIERVIEDNFTSIPDHDLLVGGFPCQDYSVATTLKNSGGLIGKKGVLWWSIFNILKGKGKDSPDYLFLENVDRLLKSPASQRGRDFAVMLSSLNELGYAVEWRVINAADYGMPQRRRRVFILGYKRGTKLYDELNKCNREEWLLSDGVFSKTFPVTAITSVSSGSLGETKEITSSEFNKESPSRSPFENSGTMINGQYHTMKTMPSYDGRAISLSDIIIDLDEVPEEYLINDEQLEKWKYLKGPKDEIRYNKAQGFEYRYNEGGMIFPDPLDRPSRTIITGEGGRSPSRFKHVIAQDGVLRRLTPIELERLNMFPDNHTKLEGILDTKRAFFMGNALVVGIIEKVGRELYEHINS